MDKLAYHYNKKKVPAQAEGKYLYYYPCVDPKQATDHLGGRGYIVVEVTEQEWEALVELDRIDYNNAHKYSRHTIPLPSGEEDSLSVAQQEQLIFNEGSPLTAVADKLDKQILIGNLSGKEQQVLNLVNEGYTQKQIAKTLGVTQGYVSFVKKQAQYNLDYAEYRSAVKVCDSEYIWKCWRLFEKKLEMPLFFDVELEFILNNLHPDDIRHFMYWYYSFGELIRYSLAYFLYNEDKSEKETAEYLSKASDQELAWFQKNYADTVPLIQIVYIRLITEVERRRENHLQGSDKAIHGLRTAIEKIAKKTNISAGQYLAERLYPIIASIRNRRIRQFYRFYTGKNLQA